MGKLALAKYLFEFMVSTVPPEHHSYYEKLDKTISRYESIADTVAEAAIEAPLFADDQSGVKTGTVLVSVATYEGFLREDIDTCKIGGDKDKNGNWLAWTLWQMHKPKKDVCSSRARGVRVAREMIRNSFATCKNYELLDRLGVYTDGFCKKNWSRSRVRMKRAMDWVSKHPFEFSEENVQ